MLETPDCNPATEVSNDRASGVSSLADDALERLLQLYEEHGPLATLEEAGRPVVFVFGAQYNQRVLSDGQTFQSCFAPLRGPRHSAQRRLTSGLITMNGEQHRQHRRRLMQSFSRPSVACYHDTIVKLVEDTLSGWREGQLRNIDHDMTELMLKITSTLLFGLDDEGLAMELGRLIDRWMSMQHDLGLAALVPDAEATERYSTLLELAEQVESKVRRMIELRGHDGRTGTDMLSRLLAARNDGLPMSEEQIIGHAALLFGAAHMTSAHTLTWSMVLAALHPQSVDGVVAKLHDMLGGRAPHPEELERLEALDAFVKESMRILPASAYSQRVVTRQIRLGKTRLERGTIVVFSPLVTHRIRSVFSEPRRFRPQRWKQLNPPPYGYIPFGGGTRLCLGGSLAPVVFKIFLSLAFQRFSPAVVRGAKFDAGLRATMLVPTSAIRLRLCRRGQAIRPNHIPGNLGRLIDLPR